MASGYNSGVHVTCTERHPNRRHESTGLRLGELTVMSVLTAMYSAGTIILAAIFLRERMTALQIFGLVLALAAAAMLALV